MAEIDVKRGQDSTRGRDEQSDAGRQATQPGQSRQLSSRERGGLSRGWGGWGMPSGSLFSMNPMELWNAGPFELMRRMSDEMDRMFQGWGAPTSGSGMWTPAVEVRERDGRLIVSAELPGLNKDDVKVEATDEGLVIQGERRQEHEERQGGVYRSERSYGSFRRVIPLPDDAQLDQAQARFEKGVLEVAIPVPQSSTRRRQIPITASGTSEPSASRSVGSTEHGGSRLGATATGAGSSSAGQSARSEEQVGSRTRS
jgi:HSP20 family protein